ncbi:MAG TPA: glycosyltransferase family 4 protein [Syntrophorhabdaceae bacterium]|nr:glycosyltransferase family 4 protein [Syntrophorhabdaceae bacterium]
MKVLNLFSDWKWTGPAEPVLSMCKALEHEGVETIVAYRKTPLDFPERTVQKEAHKRGLKCYEGFRLNRYFSIKDWWSDLSSLGAYVKKEKIDIVHTNLSHDYLTAIAALSFGAHPPIIVRTDHKRDGMPKNVFMSWALSRTDGIVTYSDKIRRQDVANFRFPEERTRVIPPGVDLYSGPIKDIRRGFGLSTGDKVIGVIGRLKPDRGFDIILKAFSIIHERVSNVKLLIMGRSSQMENSVMKPLRELGLEKDVIIAGYHIDDYFSVINLFDIFVMMRAGSDGTGRALREVMAAGKPVIVSDVGMLSDFIDEGKTGYVTRWDEIDLAQKMELMLTDDAKRQTFGENARKKAAEHWNYASQARQMKAFYEHLLRLGKRR